MLRLSESLSRSAAVLLLLLAPLLRAEPWLFDAHLHYSAPDAARLTPAQVIELLERNRIERAVVTGTPPQQVLALHAHAPARIVPILGVYRSPGDKERWARDPGLPAWVEAQLRSGPWRGVGELHLFADERSSPVFLGIVDLAAERGLPLMMHCDPAVIDALFARAPQAKVVWAHAGAYPYPPLLRDYLERYPNLYVDLSMRDERVALAGRLDPEWELLLIEYAERFMIGVDTFSTGRWESFDAAASGIRAWLDQLPPETARRIGLENAARVWAGEGPGPGGEAHVPEGADPSRTHGGR